MPIFLIPFAAGALGVLGAAALLWAWGHIAQFVQEHVIPAVRKMFGEETADRCVDLFMFLDKRACAARQLLSRGWRYFKHTVLSHKSKYTKIDAQTVRVTTEVKIRTDDNQAVKKTEVRDLGWEEVPSAIREQMIRENTKQAELDALAATEARMKERCREEGIQELEYV